MATIDDVRTSSRLRQTPPATRLLILPPSDYALEMADVVEEIEGVWVEGFIECLEPSRRGQFHAERTIHWVDDLRGLASTHAAACALGSPDRHQYISRAEAQGMRFPSLCHPSARISTRAQLATGAFVDVRAVVSSYSRIGRHTRVKRGAMIGHHTVVGNYVSIQPGVNVAGHCHIGDHAFLGMSAVVLDHITIGEHSVVGAGAVVTKDVPAHVTVVGCPARAIRATQARRTSESNE